MTRKHAQALAYALMRARPAVPTDSDSELDPAVRAWDVWARCVDAVADVCKQANGRFSRDRFLDACHEDHYVASKHGR